VRAHTKVLIGVKTLIVGALIVHWQLVSQYLQQFDISPRMIPVAVILHLSVPVGLALLVRWHWRAGK